MKAEERHQLQTNFLADQLGRLVGHSKSSGNLLWAILILVVVTGIAYWWWTSNYANQLSATWVSYWESRDWAQQLDFAPEEKLEEVAESFRGTGADAAARLTLADELYEKGYQTMFRDSPKEAAKFFEEASKTYESLKNVTNNRDVGVRALMGAARCQESLGEIERARTLYQEVLTRYGTELVAVDGTPHPLIAEAEKRLESLKKGDGLAFYSKAEDREAWPHRLPETRRERPTTPPPPPRPDEPAPPTFPEVAPTAPPSPPQPPMAPAKP